MEANQKSDAKSSNIVIRRINAHFDEHIDRHWFDNNPYTTHLINTLSLQFPSGEDKFVKSVRHYKHQITDPELKAEVRGFTAQELLHGRMHDQFNRWIAERLPSAKIYSDRIARLAEKRYKRAARKDPILNLGVTVGLEHMTAIMAANLLKRPDLLDKIHPEVRALLIWHAIEEIEHKAVAFEVFKAVGGSFRVRVMTMLAATCVFIVQTIYFQSLLLKEDGELFNGKAALDFLKKNFGLRGFMTSLIGPYLKYYSPRFHPSQTDDSELLKTWTTYLTRHFEVQTSDATEMISKGASA